MIVGQPSPPNNTVLVVDDNLGNLKLISRLLLNEECRVLTARDGKSGLEKAHRGRPDLILLDAMMPEMDGFETCRRLKADETLQKIPVIFMTALNSVEDKSRAFQLGAVDYIIKPFQPEEVSARVRTHLRLHELTERLEQMVDHRTIELQQEIIERQVAEETLRKYEYIISATDDLMSFVDTKFCYLAVNDAYLTATGKTRDEILGFSVERIVGQKIFEETAKPFLQKAFSGETVSYNQWFVDDHKRRRYFLTTYYPFLEENEQVSGVVVVAHDQTEAELAKEALRKEKELLDLVINNLPGIFTMFSESGEHLLHNGKLKELTGVSQEDLSGPDDFRFTAPRHHKYLRNIRQKLFAGELREAEIILQGKDGSEIPYLYCGNVVEIDGKQYATVLGLDISKQKKQEQQLWESKERLRLLMEQSPIPIEVYDKDGLQIAANRAYEELWELPSGTTLKEFNLFTSNEIQQSGVLDYIKRAYWGEVVRIPPFELNPVYEISKSESGHPRWLKSIAYPLLTEAGEVKNIVIVHEDITEIRQTGEEKKKLEDQLRQAQKMEAIGALAGGIAHDFNNILGVIVGQAELIDIFNSEEGSPIKPRLKQILDASERAQKLVGQILTISRHSKFATSPVDLVPLAKEVAKFIRSSTSAMISIRETIADEKMVVISDPSRMHQVFLNLCTNAVQAMGEAGGTLDVTIRPVELDENSIKQYPTLKAGSYVMIAVSDTGPGMAPYVKEKVFEPYFTTKEEGSGTGLGLAVVHGIVRSQGGHISVYSEVGKGTTFRVLLPRVEDDGSVFSEQNLEGPVTGTESVLLVDDEEQLLGTGTDILSHLGYQVTACNDPAEALELFRNSPSQFDLVITDLTMPKMSGIQLLREILKIQSDTPVILCSGFGKGVTEKSARDEGFKAFLYKPLTTKLLSQTIRSTLKI